MTSESPVLRAAVEWLLGERVPADTQAMTFVFERPIATWAWFLVLVGACTVGWWSYRRLASGRSASSRFARGGLAALRAMVIVLLAVLIAGPSVRFERTRVERDRLVVLVDRSQSLLIEDAPGGRSRAEQLVTLLEEGEPALAEIAREKDIDFIGFAGGVFTLTRREDRTGTGAGTGTGIGNGGGGRVVPDLGESTGDRTDLDGAIREGLARAAGRPVSGVLIVSDGRSIVPVSAETLRRLERDSVKVFTVALGAKDAVGDAAIVSATAPTRAFVRDRVPIEVRVDRGGTEGPLAVRLVDATTGAEIARRPVEEADGAEAVVVLDLVTEAVGARTVRAELVTERADLVRENNARSVTVELVDRPIRLLYIEGTSRWEYRYLKNLLLREEDVESSIMLLSADRDFAQEGNMPIARIPRTKEEFGRYDIFIIGDVPSGYFSPEQLAVIRSEVSERGAGLLWIGGDRSTPASWEGTVLADLIPFRPPLALETRSGGSLIRPTETAERLGVLRLTDDPTGWPEELADRGLSWPQLRFVQLVPRARLKPTAEALAEAGGTGATAQEPSAAVIRMRFGAGEVVYVATDEIWRWRYGQGERYPERFWVPLVRLLAREALASDDARAVLTVSPPRVAPGESLLVSVRFKDEETASNAPTMVPVEIRDATGTPVARVELAREGGEATAIVPADRLGAFEAVANDPAFGSAKAAFEVVRVDDEMRRGDADHELLAALAGRSGGRMLDGNGLRELPSLLPLRAREIDESVRRSIWDTPAAFAALLLLLAVEWTGRRLLRLV